MWQINWIAMVLAAVAGFAVGGLWYGPLFRDAWMREHSFTFESMAAKKTNMGQLFGTVFVLNLFSSFILGHVLATYGNPALMVSAMIAGGIGLGFVAPSIAINYMFSQHSKKLMAIDCGYWVVIYTIMGLVYGLFR